MYTQWPLVRSICGTSAYAAVLFFVSLRTPREPQKFDEKLSIYRIKTQLK